jgi:hypothetical protein
VGDWRRLATDPDLVETRAGDRDSASGAVLSPRIASRRARHERCSVIDIVAATRLLCVSSNERRTIGGRYELVRALGRGSMGEVWLAEHSTLRIPMAIKLLTRGPSGGSLEEAPTAMARFRFEAQVAARLSSKTRHIVQVIDHGEDNGVPYLVMELLNGVTLETHLVNEGRMAPASVSALVTQISRALKQAHGEGVLHRDLKPSNVFLTKDEDAEPLVKLFDFGIACMTRPRRCLTGFATVAGFMLGTPGYMSPEQARATFELDHHCDLWALATIAYEALTGDLPIEGCNMDDLLRNVCAGRIVPLRQRAPELPAGLERFFEKAFAEQKEDRFASAEEFATAFEEAAVPTRVEPVVRASRLRRRAPRLLTGVAALALVGLAMGGSARAVREPVSLAVVAAATAVAAVNPIETAGTTTTGPEVCAPETPGPSVPASVTTALAAPAIHPATTPGRTAPPAVRRVVDRSDTL